MTLATDTNWVITNRYKRSVRHTAVLRCPKHRSIKCKAHITLNTGDSFAGFYRVDEGHSLFVHNGHEPLPVSSSSSNKRPRVEENGDEEDDEDEVSKRSKLNEDNDDENNARDDLVAYPDDVVEERLKDVEGLLSDDVRARFPDELNGMSPAACFNSLYLLGRLWTDQYRRSVFKRVTSIESAELFEQVLHEHERPYFAWWAMFHAGEPNSPLVFLRVHGVSSIEVERSLMRLQRRYACLTKGEFTSSGHARHAVFTCPRNPRTSALLAINMHALRSYRMLSVDCIATSSAMPMAPVLLQFWALRPTTVAEISSRRFGMMSTLCFISTTIGLGRMTFERNGYGVMEPGFDIYDLFPAFLNQFQETDWLLRLRMHESFHVKDADICRFSNLVASFLFQKQTHFISHLVAVRLYEHFDKPHLRLRQRCPEAWRIIECAYMHRGKDDWVLLDLSAQRKREKPLRLPPAYYLYRLALEDGKGLLPDLLRWEMCTQIMVQNIYRPTSGFTRSVLYKDTLALQYYHQAFSRKSSNPVTTKLRVFSTNASHLWPLRSLFDVLRALDYHRQRAAVPCVMFDDLEPPGDFDEVDGPLRVQDPLYYAQNYTNLPVAHTVRCEVLPEGEPDLAYLDDTLWVWGSGLKEDPTPTLEAEMLVRDPAFYHVFGAEEADGE